MRKSTFAWKNFLKKFSIFFENFQKNWHFSTKYQYRYRYRYFYTDTDTPKKYRYIPIPIPHLYIIFEYFLIFEFSFNFISWVVLYIITLSNTIINDCRVSIILLHVEKRINNILSRCHTQRFPIHHFYLWSINTA